MLSQNSAREVDHGYRIENLVLWVVTCERGKTLKPLNQNGTPHTIGANQLPLASYLIRGRPKLEA